MIRQAFLETAREARELIATRDVERAWNEPSALRELTTGALAAHLARAVSTVAIYLDVPLPDPTPATITADVYYATATGLTRDISSDLNAAIRQRSDESAAAGHAAVVSELDATIVSVASALASEPADRAVAVIGGAVMHLDEYLVTRMVELVVHLDDLAVSVGRDTPDVNEVTRACVIGCLLAVARIRHGDTEVIRSFTRSERARPDVFPVL